MTQLLGLDTNIFIYHYQKHPEFIQYTRPLIRALIEERTTSVTSFISLIEILSFKAPDKEIANIQDAFYSTPNLLVLPVNGEISLQAAEIRRRYNYRLPDAIQLATALYAKADMFVTNDQRLSGFKELQVKMLTEF